MKKLLMQHVILLMTVLLLSACDQPAIPSGSISSGETLPETALAAPALQATRAPVLREELLMPSDLLYLGAFRLPDASGGSSWEYSGQGLAYYPLGDPAGEQDGFPGSLFGFGHDQHMLVSEISIPEPIDARNVQALNTAITLQPFADLTGGLLDPQRMDLPVADLAFLPAQAGMEADKLHFVFGQHFQDFEPSLGWSDLQLDNPRPAGAWSLAGVSNYTSNDYLFEIPEEWAAAYMPGQRLACGRFREGVWGGGGPALYAYTPWLEGDPPPADAALTAFTPLLLYGKQLPGESVIVFDESQQMQDFQEADHWSGGAWLTSERGSAMVMVGTKALGASWYGFANGVEWAYDCADQSPPTCPDVPEWPYDQRGYWAEDYQAQVLFYDPAELSAVALGELDTWEPQPYAVLVLDDYLFSPQIDLQTYKRDLLGAAAFDRQNRLLYIMERQADGEKSVIHVWQVE